MSTRTGSPRSSGMDVLARHLLLAALSAAGAASAGGVFTARALRTRDMRTRIRWAALACFEFAIAGTVIRGVITRRRGQRQGPPAVGTNYA
jgi:hypothetical protein